MSSQQHTTSAPRRSIAPIAVAIATVLCGYAAITAQSVFLAASTALLLFTLVWHMGRSLADRPTPAEHAGGGRAAADSGSDASLLATTPAQPRLDSESVIRALMVSASTVVEPVASHMWLTDESSGSLRPVALVGPMAPSSAPVSLDEDSILAAAARSSASEFGPLARVQSTTDERVLWRFALPIQAGHASGVVALDFASDGEPDVSGLAAVTAEMMPSVAAALALHVAESETELARNLLEAARELSRILDPDEVLTSAMNRAVRLCDAATASVMLLEPSTQHLIIVKSHGLPPEVVRDTSIASGEGIAGWVLATSQPLLIEDLPARQRGVRRHGVRSAVSVPIGDDDGVLGVLNVGSKSFPSRFTESHLRALETLGKQAAVAYRNARAVESSREVYFDTLRALALAMETKDPYAVGGTDRVVEFATLISEAFGLDPEQAEALRIASLLHDIGMPAAGESVASEHRTLSTVERALLKMHPQIAAEVLGEAPALKSVVPIVYHHHEWFDGRGYGGGLAGESIPLGARILAVADAFVAMTSPRPYRTAMSEAEALTELHEKAGTQFDPTVVEVLSDVLRRGSNRVPSENRW